MTASWKEMQLPKELIGDLYKDNLVILTPRTASSENWPKEEVPSALHQGGNAKKITLLADLGKWAARGNPTNLFIQKLLEACKLTIDDIALVNTHREIPSLALLQQQLHPSVILLFGQDPAQLGLPIRFPEFKLQAHDSITFLLLPGLHAFLAEDESAKLLKSKLWVCLKSLFRL